eukprot:176392-Rhodomonas_salina.1
MKRADGRHPTPDSSHQTTDIRLSQTADSRNMHRTSGTRVSDIRHLFLIIIRILIMCVVISASGRTAMVSKRSPYSARVIGSAEERSRATWAERRGERERERERERAGEGERERAGEGERREEKKRGEKKRGERRERERGERARRERGERREERGERREREEREREERGER